MRIHGIRPTPIWSVSSITSHILAIRRSLVTRVLTVSTCHARILLTVLTVLRSTVAHHRRTVSYFYPPRRRHTVEVYYAKDGKRIERDQDNVILIFFLFLLQEYLRKAAPYVEGGYNDIDPGLNPALQDHYRITPSPGGPGDQYGTFNVFRGEGRFLDR